MYGEDLRAKFPGGGTGAQGQATRISDFLEPDDPDRRGAHHFTPEGVIRGALLVGYVVTAARRALSTTCSHRGRLSTTQGGTTSLRVGGTGENAKEDGNRPRRSTPCCSDRGQAGAAGAAKADRGRAVTSRSIARVRGRRGAALRQCVRQDQRRRVLNSISDEMDRVSGVGFRSSRSARSHLVALGAAVMTALRFTSRSTDRARRRRI